LPILANPFASIARFPLFPNAWRTSWFARGILFTIFFSGFAFVQLAVGHPFVAERLGPVATPLFVGFGVLAGIFAFMTGIYGGFIMNYCKSVPFWNTWILPVVFALAGIADGFALMMGIGLGGGGGSIAVAEFWGRIVLISSALMITVYLVRSSLAPTVARESARRLIRGHVAVAFWLGIVVLGIIVPLGVSIFSVYAGEASSLFLIAAIACHTFGAFALKYCLLKVGFMPRL